MERRTFEQRAACECDFAQAYACKEEISYIKFTHTHIYILIITYFLHKFYFNLARQQQKEQQTYE